MLQPLVIGNHTFPTNLIQGPLAGVSCAPFRLLTHRYGKPAFSYTEMISCKTLIHQPKSSLKRFILKDPEEGLVCFQLSGDNPKEIAEAVKIVTEQGADLIDLNCGCPVNKIRRKGAGSSLLSDSKKLYDLIIAMKQNTHLPVSVKIRVDGNSQEKFNQTIATVINDSGADFLTVHGRHWSESYDTPCHYDQIQFFVETLSIPVIGNGDVSDFISLKKMLATGCAGAMIARAGVGQPWLIQQLSAEINQKQFKFPSSKDIGLIFLEHVERLVSLLDNEKFAILQARKFAKYYARRLENRVDFCSEINNCETLINLKLICEKYFP